jgi:SAM-dependent methyltransferase
MKLQNEIQILPVSLLDEQRQSVEQIKAVSRRVKVALGWHYLLDISWAFARLGNVAGKRVMDAGAGRGIPQWYLAEKGAEMVSVDRMSRADLPMRFRARYRVSGLRPEDLLTPIQAAKSLMKDVNGLPRKVMRLARFLAYGVRSPFQHTASGKIIIYNQDLLNLPDIPDNSLDAIVSISALEHNSPETLLPVVESLMSKLKPGGALLATLGANPEQDWFHQPSQGWCYTEKSLRKLFALPETTPSNYAYYAEYFDQLRNCTELRDNLADFYFRSENNGMPGGRWDPKYMSVGVCKVKE